MIVIPRPRTTGTPVVSHSSLFSFHLRFAMCYFSPNGVARQRRQPGAGEADLCASVPVVGGTFLVSLSVYPRGRAPRSQAARAWGRHPPGFEGRAPLLVVPRFGSRSVRLEPSTILLPRQRNSASPSQVPGRLNTRPGHDWGWSRSSAVWLALIISSAATRPLRRLQLLIDAVGGARARQRCGNLFDVRPGLAPKSACSHGSLLRAGAGNRPRSAFR